MSPASGTGMSPSYPHSEPSPDYTMIVQGSRSNIQRPPSPSPPLTPSSQGVSSIGERKKLLFFKDFSNKNGIL